VVTDAGSTKEDVVAAARLLSAVGSGSSFPAHPIAGAENSGALAARADLYRQKQVVLTPLPENSPQQVARVRSAWECCGGLVRELSAAEHDRVLPRSAICRTCCRLRWCMNWPARQPRAPVRFAASGFRDFTRIAASHPEMWRDICLANRSALLDELDRYRRQLDDLRDALQRGDGASLETTFAVARTARREWAEKQP
jgi:prephenate dehydrogenase